MNLGFKKGQRGREMSKMETAGQKRKRVIILFSFFFSLFLIFFHLVFNTFTVLKKNLIKKETFQKKQIQI